MSTVDRFISRGVLPRLSRLRNRHFLLLDFVAFCVTPALALLLRLEGHEGLAPYLPALTAYTLAALGIRLAIFYACGFYNQDWRYTTLDGLAPMAYGTVLSLALTTLFSFSYPLIRSQVLALPHSLPILDGLLALVAIGSLRVGVRLALSSLRGHIRRSADPVLVVGAGIAGRGIAKELLESDRLKLRPIGFVDDDATKQGLRIFNLPVFGGRECLVDVVNRHHVAQVIIALPGAAGKTIRDYLTRCEAAGVPAKTIPGLSAILDNKVKVSQLRNVEIEDLLRREPVQTDVAAVWELIRGKRVLITGGGGSIGRELCRQILSFHPSALTLLGHGENSVFEIQNELERELAAHSDAPYVTEINAVIADIRFSRRISKTVCEAQPDIIFHAAAHKHVPLMELNPSEAITNNVFGTRNLLDAALAAGVERFVLISTDKAVNPTSVMGASKRVAELLVLRAARQSGNPYVAVRFGNVLGSRGSVVPTFKRQIAAGGPVTVSHPEMSRYFMTIPEAVQLLLQASVLGQGGEIFMLDMGEPVKIVDLARDLIELSGLELGQDIDIVYSGIRPGEKLVEELFIPGERYERTQHYKILLASNASAFVPRELDKTLLVLGEASARDDRAAIIGGLRQLLPEFQPDEARHSLPALSDPGVEPVETGHAVVAAPPSTPRYPRSNWIPVSGE